MTEEKTVRSALCVVLPYGVTEGVQAVRREHDRSYGRWPPHVNLLYPFVPEAAAGARVAELSAALRDVVPFRVTFAELKHFRHTQRSFTLWVEPAPREAFIALQRCVQRVFPALTDLSTIEAFGFTPHLSLGQWRAQAALDSAQAALQAAWRPFSCVVDAVHIITRRDDEPFAVRWTVPLGGGTPFAGPPPGLLPASPLAISMPSSSSTASGSAAGSGEPTPTPRRVYAWRTVGKDDGKGESAGQWRPMLPGEIIADAAEREPLGDVRVATWNVFHDADDTPLFCDSLRRDAVVAHIAQLAARSDVLVLTETTPELLTALLQQDWLRRDFCVSDVAFSEGGNESGNGHQQGQNKGTTSGLAAASFIFVAARRAFRQLVLQHSAAKRTVMAVFPDADGVCARLAVAGVHLTSNFRAAARDAVAARVRQLSAIARALSALECPALVAGDFNVADGPAASTEARALRALLPGFVDAWRACRGRAPGATFDPTTNRTAAATARTPRPARIDRILVQAAGSPDHHWIPADAEVVLPPLLPTTGEQQHQKEDGGASGSGSDDATPPFYVSDHYSLVVCVGYHAGPCPPMDEPVTTLDEYLDAREGGEGSESGSNSSGDVTQTAVEKALRVVQKAVARCGAPRIFVNPAGSYGLGAWRAGGDVDLVCASAEPRTAFFRRLGTQLLALRCPCAVAVSAVVPVLRTTVRGVALELQHCRAPARIVDALPSPARSAALFAALRSAQLAPPTPLKRAHTKNNSDAAEGEAETEQEPAWDEADVRAIAGWADAQVITSVIPEALRSVFARALAAVKQWAKVRGVYSCRMGYPGGIGYTIMVARLIQKAIAANSNGANISTTPQLTVENLVGQFFAVYAAHDFATTPIALAGCSGSGSGSASGAAARGVAAKMVIWTPARPHFNVTRNSTRASVWCLRRALTEAHAAIEGAGGPARVDWEVFLEQNHHRPLLRSPRTVAVVLVTVSALARASFDSWRNCVESRLVRLTVALEGVCPPGVVPVPFSRAFYSPEPTYPHQCCFVSVLHDASGASPLAAAEPDAVTKEFLAPAQAWEHSVLIQKPGDGFISVWCYSPEKMPKWLLADGAVQPSNAAAQDGSDDDDDGLDLETFLESLEHIPTPDAGTQHTPEPAKPVSGAAHPKGATTTKKQGGSKLGTGAQAPTTKLRTSEDVYNRIMWDPLLNKAEYTICYEDRFLGLMEVPFESFDRENIPFHRVWMFKHRGDVVWDREKRIDLVF